MGKEGCKCLNSAFSVFADLLQACDRMDVRKVSDDHVAKWLAGYRDGIFTAQERFRVTAGECCCRKKDTP